MKNPVRKDNKKDGKPFNINISFNINSKNVTNGQLLSQINGIKHHGTSSEQKQQERLNGVFSRTPKNLQQCKHTKESTQFLRQHPRLYKSKRNSMDLFMLANHDLQKRKLQTKSDKLSSFKRKNSKNSGDIKLNSKQTSNVNIRKKNHESQLGRVSPVTLDFAFKDYQHGNITLEQMKDVISDLISAQSTRTRKKSAQINFTNAKLSKHTTSNLCNIDPKKLDLMRKRNCRSERGDISSRKHQNQTFLSSARESIVIRNIVNVKGINSSLMLSSEEDTSPPSPRLKQNSMTKAVKTANSVIDIRQKLQRERYLFQQGYTQQVQFNFQNRMAIKIQRLWRQYQTRQIIKQLVLQMNRTQSQNQLILQTDVNSLSQYDKQIRITIQKNSGNQLQHRQVTDLWDGHNQLLRGIDQQEIFNEQLSQCLDNCVVDCQERKEQILKQSHLQQQQSDQFVVIKNVYNNSENSLKDVVDIIRMNLENKQLSKDQCLKNILEMIQGRKNTEQDLERSRIRKQDSQLHEITSFTNKFQSKQILGNQIQFEINSSASGSDVGIQDYGLKETNINSIQQALRNRQHILLQKREKELNLLHFRNESDRISDDVYLLQKIKVEKWYKFELSELRKAKKNLLKGYKDAKNVIEKISQLDFNEDTDGFDRPKGVVKCLSDKYLVRTALNYKHYIEGKGQQRAASQKFLGLKREKQRIQVQPDNEDQFNLQYEQISKEFDEISEHNRETLGYVQSSGITQAKQIGLFDNYDDDSTRKLRYLCSQDKDDIFQFIFLDLCLQIYLQNPKTSKIIRSLDRTIQNSKRMSKVPKGIKTNLAYVKQYLLKFGSFILQQHRNTLNKLQFPMGPTAAEMLKYMHQIPEDQKQISSVNQEAAPLVLAGTVFQIFEKKSQNSLKLQKYYDDPDKENNRMLLLNSVMHIHNKALFDSVNENLDQERPYGLWGKPFPWKKAIQANTRFSDSQKQKKLKKSLQKTIQTCSYLCGIMVDKEQSLFSNINVSQEYVNHIKEDRLSKMLANDLIENQERWMFYDDQQTEVLIQISNFVAKEMVYSVIDDLIFLMKARASQN